MNARAWAAGLAATVCAGAWLFWLSRQPVRWDALAQATCMPASCFCEAPRDAAVRQPSDTWSNLAYVFVGGFLIGGAWRDRALARAFGLIAFFLGLTSAWFHASLTYRGEFWDVFCMYLIPACLLAVNLHRAGRLGPRGRWAFLAASAGGIAAFLANSNAARLPAFIALIVLYLASEVLAARRAPARRRRLWAAIGTFALSFGIWLLDKTHLVCSPYSLWQGHAVWHVLCAAVLWLLFRCCDENAFVSVP